MSIKNLFNKSATLQSATSSSVLVESNDYVNTKNKLNDTFHPYIDFSDPANFAKFGLAEEYYTLSIERIHDNYPYDGSDKEKILFDISSSYLDKYILEKRYPKSNGYINLSNEGWGTQTSIADGYGLSNSNEFILVRGSIHVNTDKQYLPLKETFDKSVIYNSDKNRVSSTRMNLQDGLTVEFWLKKDSFDTAKTEKEVILDLWNGELSSSSNYGRFTLALSGTLSGEDTFIVTLQSGSNGFYEESIGTSAITTSSLGDWHHYSLSFVSASSGVDSRIYVDGNLNESKSLGSTGINEVGGLINGYIGALQTSPSGSTASQYAGKLSASLDDFRYWKKRRTSEEIYNNWYRHVAGGTNSEDNNVYLGFYYKFNEGILGTSADSNILDYSGRLANGVWTGYTSGARSTSSAFVESGLVSSEAQDPIIYSNHADVVSLKEELQELGQEHDRNNTARLYNKVPYWVQIEDEQNGFPTKKLYQIISSYFDTLHSQITALPFLKNKVFPSSSYSPIPFADRLVEEKGLLVADLFADSNVLEMFGERDLNQIQYEKKIVDIKNQIYTNIYNNLEDIYKHKGTEGAIRNMLRCFGVDDELVKLNIYTDQGIHYFTDSYKHTSINKKYIDFNKKTHNQATIFNETSSINSNSYISGSGLEKLEQYNALTAEISIIVPKKAKFEDKGFYRTLFQSSSVFGMHQAISSSVSYAWDTPDLANFQVYLVRDQLESDHAKFVLKDYAENIVLETDVFKEIYSNEQWNLAVRIKPEDYPIAGNVVTSSNRDYILEFYGVTHAFDTVKEEFLLTASLNYDTGSAYLSNSKRFYIGAHKQNFIGTTLQSTDIKVGKFNVWLDYLEDEVIKLHNLDITSKGNYKTFRPSTIFGKNLEQIEVPSYELSILDWDFETVTNSDSSGEFVVIDTTSGSIDSRYGWVDGITRRKHDGVGYGFPNSSTVVGNEIIYSSKKELPEISYSSDGVIIKGEREELFIEDEDVSDNFYALEKSMYQTISEEMMRTLSTAQEMSNLIGEAVERYRLEYKKLNHVRRMFFENVEEDPDFDRFTEYFKWIDSSVSYMVSQMFPASVRFSKGISDVVESHLFERNKYQNKFPLISTHTATEGRITGVGQSKYRWEFGHAPFERIAAAPAEVNFDADEVFLIDNGAFLEITGGATTYLAETLDPNNTSTRTSVPDKILYTGSNGLALRAVGSTITSTSNSSYTGLGSSDFSVSFWLWRGDSFNDQRFQWMDTGNRHKIEFDQDIRVYYYNSLGGNSSHSFDTNLSLKGNNWNHYVVHFNVSDLTDSNNKPRLWQNGVELSPQLTYTAPGGTTPTITRLFLYLDDLMGMQDIIVWDKLLTQEDIDLIYANNQWVNPQTHPSASNIVDWYKFGYEEYWSTLGYVAGNRIDAYGSIPYTISSSYGSGLNDLSITTTLAANNFYFIEGFSPFGTTKSNTEFWDELSSSLSSSFSDFSVSYQDNGTYGSFNLIQNNASAMTIDISETGNDFSNISTIDYVPSYLQADPNVNCLWRNEREERTDVPEREIIRQIIGNRNNAPGTIVSGSSGTYTNSNYGVRRFSKPLDMNAVISQTLHPGINYFLQKDRDYVWSATNRHSQLSPAGFPKNVLLVGAGPGQGIELPVECDDVEVPNKKKKYNTKVYVGKHSEGTSGGSFTPIDDSDSYTYAVKGAFKLPFEIFSGSVTTGYNSNIASGYRSDAVVTNLHSDTTDFSNDIPLQGPFSSQWVGGHQSRHIELNRYDAALIDGETLTAPPNNIHNRYTRPEAWRLLVVEAVSPSDGAIGMVDAQYGVTAIPGHPNNGKYPDVAKKAATLYRDGRVKRAMNIANIQTTTSSINHGNFTENYEIVSVGGGKKENNLFFRKNSETYDFLPSEIESILPQTTNYQTLVAVSNHNSGNVFGVGESNILNSYIEVLREPSLSFNLKRPSSIDSIDDGHTIDINIGATNIVAEIDTDGSSDPSSDVVLETYRRAFKATGTSFANTYSSYTGILTNQNFSITFWYNNTTGETITSTTQLLFYQTVGGVILYNVDIEDDITIAINDSSGTLLGTCTYPAGLQVTNTWSHIHIAFEVTNLASAKPRLWKNGVEIPDVSYTPPGGTITQGTINQIYVRLDDQDAFQDVIVWDDIIADPADIGELYNGGKWIKPTELSFSAALADWWQYGNEEYWYTDAGLLVGDTLDSYAPASSKYISSSAGVGTSLLVTTAYDQDLTFIKGFGEKEESQFWERLSSSLENEFTNFTMSYTPHSTYANFSFTQDVFEIISVTAPITGDSFYDVSAVSTLIEKGYFNTTTIATESVTRTVISSRFSAPGSIDTMTYGFLDAYSQEYSVYNNLNYRNLSVRGIDVRVSSSADGTDYYNFGGSGEAGTIRAANHLDQRDGHKALLSRHMGKFGVDARYAAELNDEPLLTGSYNQNPAYHGQHRNTNRRPADSSTLLAPVLLERHDNMYVSSLIPRSDFQYKWVTSSLGDNYSITSGKQRMYGYAHPTGILSSSVVIDGDSGFVPAITFPTASEIFGE